MDLGVWHNFDICVYVILCNHIIYIYHKIITWYSLVWWSSRSGSWDGWPSCWGTNVLTFVFWLFSWMFEWHLGGRRDGCMRGCVFLLRFFPRKPKHKVVELLTVFDLIETWSCKIGGFTINGMMDEEDVEFDMIGSQENGAVDMIWRWRIAWIMQNPRVMWD